MAWIAALKYKGPYGDRSLASKPFRFSFDKMFAYEQGMGAAPILFTKKKGQNPISHFFSTARTLFGSRSRGELEKLGKKVRVVSMPCWRSLKSRRNSISIQSPAETSESASRLKRRPISDGNKYIGIDGVGDLHEGFGHSAPAAI